VRRIYLFGDIYCEKKFFATLSPSLASYPDRLSFYLRSFIFLDPIAIRGFLTNVYVENIRYIWEKCKGRRDRERKRVRAIRRE